MMADLRLRSLGAVELQGSGADPGSVLRAPKRFALLAYLALADGFCRRDVVVGLLWPDRSQEQARNVLRNTLHHLRRALGPDVIVNRGTQEIGLRPGAVECDAVLLAEAVEAGRDDEAVRLYGGPFLEGLHVPGASPDFEAWVHEQRRRLERLRASALTRLAEDAEGRGDYDEAVLRWRELASQDPYSSRIARRLMEALDAAGDRPAALRYARIHAELVRAELGADPDPAVVELANRLRSAPPERPAVVSPTVSPVETLDPAPSTRPSEAELPVPVEAGPPVRPAAHEPRVRLPRAAWLVGIAALVLTPLVFLLRPSDGMGLEDRDFILVTELSNRTGEEVFDGSLQTALTIALRQSQFVNLVPAGQVRATLARMGADSAARIDVPMALEIAQREPWIKAVLAVDVTRLDTVYALSGQLLDPTTGAVVLAEEVRAGGRAAVLPALDSLGRVVRRRLGESLSAIDETSVALPRATTSSLSALKLFAVGQGAWDEGRPEEARTLWSESVALDSGFAWAHASLGMANRWIDGAASDAAVYHYEVAETLLDDLGERERLWIRSLIEVGRGNTDEAVATLRSYLRVYPDDAVAWANLGRQLWGLGELDEAAEAYARALRLNPADASARINVAFIYDRLGRFKEAATSFEEAFALQPDARTRQFGGVNHRAGFVYMKLDDPERARETFRAMLAGTQAQRADGLRSLALTDMFYGHHRSAMEGFREAALLSRAAGMATSEFRNRLYLARAASALGEDDVRERELDGLHDMVAPRIAATWLRSFGVELVAAGRLGEATAVLAELEAREGQGGDGLHRRWLQAEIAVAEGRVQDGLDSLEVSHRVVDAPLSADALARARARAGDYNGAARLYRELIDDRYAIGYESQEPWFLARYHLGLLAEEGGDGEAAREHYEDLIELWADGDEDLLVLRDARARSARLMEDSRRTGRR